jgi:hypothetical protein
MRIGRLLLGLLVAEGVDTTRVPIDPVALQLDLGQGAAQGTVPELHLVDEGGLVMLQHWVIPLAPGAEQEELLQYLLVLGSMPPEELDVGHGQGAPGHHTLRLHLDRHKAHLCAAWGQPP